MNHIWLLSKRFRDYALGLTNDIKDLHQVSEDLRQGVYRLLVLGDRNRGKSTLVNVLIGEDLLPQNVVACTALITIVRYGPRKKVTVYFNDGRAEPLSFEEFRSRYTINSQETKRMEEEGQIAFPEVDYAVVECPLEILETGIEIVDSPGLNDTEERNERVLGYIKNCSAVLFVMSAIEQMTLEEQRYLDNYIKGLPVFFLINLWDLIKNKLPDPNDIIALSRYEAQIREVLLKQLGPYCMVDGKDLYHERVFELCSLQALQRRLKGESLTGTGFPEFLNALDDFLRRGRTKAQLRKVKMVAQYAHQHIHEAVKLRLSLLDHSMDKLKSSIDAVKPQFEQLQQIRDSFVEEIHNVGIQRADQLADSFYQYISRLPDTFEHDFAPYQPKLKYLSFFSKKGRASFENDLKKAFNQYLNDRMAVWSREAEQAQATAFAELAVKATRYAVSYRQITDNITERVTGYKVDTATITTEDRSPGWARWVAGAASIATGDFVGAGMAASGAFNWKAILINISAFVAINAVLYSALHVVLTPLGGIVAGLLTSGAQAEMGRRRFMAAARQEMAKVLPQIAQEQAGVVRQMIRDAFTAYQDVVVTRMNEDIQSFEAQLQNLSKQKSSREINLNAEKERLVVLDRSILSMCQGLNDAYERFVAL